MSSLHRYNKLHKLAQNFSGEGLNPNEHGLFQDRVVLEATMGASTALIEAMKDVNAAAGETPFVNRTLLKAAAILAPAIASVIDVLKEDAVCTVEASLFKDFAAVTGYAEGLREVVPYVASLPDLPPPARPDGVSE
jgi:hypothetical protein